MMKISEVDFKGSFVYLDQCPEAGLPEYAFIGRSNVGKSSLINLLTNRKELAKVSGSPGKTQTLNFFLVDQSWYLVDLPGYGYARISKKQRQRWKQMIENYIGKRSTLVNTFVLIDSNIPPQPIDLEFINWLGAAGIPFSIVYTKEDKSKSQELALNHQAFRREMLKSWSEMPPEFHTSTVTKMGDDSILMYIANLNEGLGK